MGSNRYQDRWESPPYFYLAFFINAALLHVNDAKRLYMIKYCNYLSVNFCKKPCKNMKKNIKKRYWEINILATSKNIKDIFPIILPQLCPLTKEKVKKKYQYCNNKNKFTKNILFLFTSIQAKKLTICSGSCAKKHDKRLNSELL